AISQRLRRGAERDERRDRTPHADAGMTGDMHMRGQRRSLADRDVAPNDAVRPDRRTFADHRTIFNARGGIDSGHMVRSKLAWPWLAVQSVSMAPTSASAPTAPRTRASP